MAIKFSIKNNPTAVIEYDKASLDQLVVALDELLHRKSSLDRDYSSIEELRNTYYKVLGKLTEAGGS